MVSKIGDFGDVAVEIRSAQKFENGQGIDLENLITAMNEINLMQGNNSV